MVTQTAYLFPRTIADNLRFGPVQQGSQVPAKTIEALLAQVGLASRGEEDVAHLSGGEALPRNCMDPRADGRHALVWSESHLCGHVPVCDHFDDLFVVPSHSTDLQSIDSQRRVFARPATHAASSPCPASGRSACR